MSETTSRSPYRNKAEIFVSILKCTNEGMIKSRIQAQIYTSYTRLETYLAEMSENGLIVARGSRYYTTEKGRKFLDRYSAVMELVPTLVVAQ